MHDVFTDTREQAIPLFMDADIVPFMYYKTVASLMHDINSNNSPTNLIHLKNLCNLFIPYAIVYFRSVFFTLKAESWKYTQTPCLVLA